MFLFQISNGVYQWFQRVQNYVDVVDAAQTAFLILFVRLLNGSIECDRFVEPDPDRFPTSITIVLALDDEMIELLRLIGRDIENVIVEWNWPIGV